MTKDRAAEYCVPNCPTFVMPPLYIDTTLHRPKCPSFIVLANIINLKLLIIFNYFVLSSNLIQGKYDYFILNFYIIF